MAAFCKSDTFTANKLSPNKTQNIKTTHTHTHTHAYTLYNYKKCRDTTLLSSFRRMKNLQLTRQQLTTT